MTDVTFHFRGGYRRCRIVGHCGRNRDVPVGYYMMPTTGTRYLLVGDGKAMTKGQRDTFETDDSVARKAFVALVQADYEQASRTLKWQRDRLVSEKELVALADGLGEEWTEIPFHPDSGRTYAGRVRAGELHTTHLGEGGIAEINGWSVKWLGNMRDFLVNAPNLIARSEKKVAKLTTLLEKWSASP